MTIQRKISLKKVKVHNLKDVDLTLDPNELIVFTGVSGSGKSSLAFDTLYMEGQRRYVESLAHFAKRQMGEMSKPNLESASGISPTISIEQKTAGKNPRSTVGTLTEIYDYLRVLFARVGLPHCPISGEAVLPQSRERIIKTVQSIPDGSPIIILSPYAQGKKAEFREDFQELLKKGFTRARVDGTIIRLDEEILLDRTLSHDVEIVFDRIDVNKANHSRIAESITQALQFSNGICLVINVLSNEEIFFSMHAWSPKSGISYPSLEPHDFSFNSPYGMCPRCNGLGKLQEFDLEKIIDPEKSISNDCCQIASSYQTVRYGNIYDNLANLHDFDVNMPWKNLSDKAKKVFLYGTDKKWTRMRFVHPNKPMVWMDYIMWKGVLHDAHKRFQDAKSERYKKKMLELMNEQICPECSGSRLKSYPAATLFLGKSIHEISQMTIQECFSFFENASLKGTEALIAEELLKEIRTRLHFLNEVGLHYLTLDRTAPTLAGGEAQRVRLASQIGCGLVGITYILDEPSIGLHPRDNDRLIQTLKQLRDKGNTIIVVEHDEDTIWASDRIVDFGPGPGKYGGNILVNGPISELLHHKESITSAYLSGKASIEVPLYRKEPKKSKWLTLKGATHHNLKNITLKIPLGLFIVVTGVSGSGKSSLISETLYPILSNKLHRSDLPTGPYKNILGIKHIDKVISIDQSPIGKNPRSNPATYIKVLDEIRDLFSTLPESQARGYQPGRFSFNVKDGSCSQCQGMGMILVDMDFMEDEWVDCPLCNGRRFDPETLTIYYKGKTIFDVLEMEVSEAREFFTHHPSIRKKLETLEKVGMGYIKLGQSSTTLSGGEAQRVKLAKELARPATGNTFFILDEPTTGLHFHDINHLLKVLHELVERGNTVCVIEHNMDIVKTADWIIDLGPDGGKDGGQIIATGTPEKISKLKSPSGIAVKHALFPHREERVKRHIKQHKQQQKPKKQFIQNVSVEGAEQNNLKRIDVEIPREKITICTGPSGSGKSSLAIDTLYAEGQRRYTESLSPYARQFIKQMPKPTVIKVEGLSPAIAIEQKAHAGNPRSTIGTMTEIYDYLRILYARKGTAHCPETGEIIKAINKDFVIDTILSYPEGEKIQILAPIDLKGTRSLPETLSQLKRLGYVRIKLNETEYELDFPDIPYDHKRKNTLFLIIDRLKVHPNIRMRLFEAVENAAKFGENTLVIQRENEEIFFNLSFAVESTGKSYPTITPQTFAFNTREGMCIDCFGLGYQYGANLLSNPEIASLSPIGLLRNLWGSDMDQKLIRELTQFFSSIDLPLHTPMKNIAASKLKIFLNGTPDDNCYTLNNGIRFRWIGIHPVLAKAGKTSTQQIKEAIIPFLSEEPCLSCNGSRLNPLARNVKIKGHTIVDICRMSIEKCFTFIKSLSFTEKEAKLLEDVLSHINTRLRFLIDVGLNYLSLDRKAPTLSGGESQRIRLARQLGTELTGVLYVLDEPTIGLHPRDGDRLNKALHQLKALGNTLLLVEHDPLTIAEADFILDFGPHAGIEGGHIVAQGTYKQILQNPKSLTGKYLSGKLSIPLPKQRRPKKRKGLTLKNVKTHNLKNISLQIPAGLFTCITGVSGAGKSTLIHDVLLPAVQKSLFLKDSIKINETRVSGLSNFDKVLSIDQNPIGHTTRSDVSTYVDLLTPIRHFFSSLPLARAKGLEPKHFSTNHKKGMCTNCFGMGYKRVQMHFLPSVQITCPECTGLRLNPVSLEVKYDEKNLGEHLQTTVTQARQTFQNIPRIRRTLDTLLAVGLGYLKLGQEMVSLSGGEAQRIKLNRELVKRSTGKTLYLLDEPTTGLHSDDILKLLVVLQNLVEKGNTLIIIEHQMDVIKQADYVIELGPEAGDKGGNIVCQGTPEEIAQFPNSWTGKYLKSYLGNSSLVKNKK